MMNDKLVRRCAVIVTVCVVVYTAISVFLVLGGVWLRGQNEVDKRKSYQELQADAERSSLTDLMVAFPDAGITPEMTFKEALTKLETKKAKPTQTK